MNIHDNRRRFQNSQIGLAQPTMTATRSATDFEIMQQEHIERLKAELAEARAEIDGLTLMATNASMEPARRLIQKNKELHAVIEQMREALQWYKEQVSSCNRNGDAGELARDRLAKDVGKRAEAALAAERLKEK